jgi:threonine dehydrogenase-like Zn-dependent dehydrogenase
MAVYSATLRGASRIYAVDHVRERLDQAPALGALPIDFTSSEGSASEQILRRQPQGVQRVVDCIGQSGLNAKLRPQQNYVINEAIKVASFTGGIGIVALYGALPTSEGVPRGDTMDPELLIRYPDAWTKGLTFGNGAIVGMYEVLPRLFELVRTGKARLDFIVSAQVGIEDAPKMYERFDKKLETKVIIRFPWTREVAPLAASESVEDERPMEVEELKQNGHAAQNGHGSVRRSHLPL